MHSRDCEIRVRSIFKTILLSFILCITSAHIHTQASVESSALDLVSPQRADLMAKYIYAKHREWQTSCQFGRNIYYYHLKVWHRFYEENPIKQTFTDFKLAFDNLLDSIKNGGFNSSYAIPLGENGVICNGAHRVTSCLLYNKDIAVDRNPTWWGDSYNFDFFKEQGLATKYLDAMALQYCELKPDSYIMVIFPSAVGYHNEIEQIINTYAKIVYKKNITFTDKGGLNFIRTAYDKESWIKDGGAYNKARACFPKKLLHRNPARVYLLQSDNLDLIKICKSQIRALFNISHDSVHSNDTHKEAIVLARSLFNRNSIHFLNHKKDVLFPQFEHYFKEYRNWLEANQKNNEWFCIDGSAVMAAYGLRDCSDLDFLHFEKETPITNIVGLDSHNCHLHFHASSLDDILFDPDNYFYYNGIKFCSLFVLKQMKMRRLEPKDLDDLKLIKTMRP